MWQRLMNWLRGRKKPRSLTLLAEVGQFLLTGFESMPRRLRVAFQGQYRLTADTGSFAVTPPATTLLTYVPNQPGPGALSTLAANTARDLGPYKNTDPQFTGTPISGANLDADYITDYSGIAIDSARNRVVMFGGGHGFCQETDIRVLDLSTLTWSSLYTPTPASAMLNNPANVDTFKGRWITSNQPTARHTYCATVVRGNEFHMIGGRGQPFDLGDSTVNWLNYWGGRSCKYNFTTGVWTYGSMGSAHENLTLPYLPWENESAVCIEPASNSLLIAGATNGGGGQGGIWLYNPDTDTFQTGPTWPNNATVYHGDGCVVYFPPNGKFYFFHFSGTSTPVDVYEITLNASNFSQSTITGPLTITGARPSATLGLRNGFAYDTVNGNIGGCIIAGVYYAFAPVSRAWTATTMLIEAGSTTNAPPYSSFFNITFDPNSGCFIFLQNEGSGVPHTTWAYRPPGVATSNAVSDLSVTLDFGGGSVATFNGSAAVDKGDYIGEFVRQKSFMATNAGFPDWRVWFRVDADSTTGTRITQPATGWRDEIIVEYGRTTNGTPANRTTSYTATVKKAGSTVATISVPYHFWFSRWRYQSSQRPVVRTPASLIARQWLPKFGSTGLYGRTADAIDTTWTGPFMAPTQVTTGNYAGSSVWNPFMGQGGDHDELGYLTEQAASYVIFSNANSLRTVRAQGEWCGNWCMHLREDSTGNMPSFRDTTTKVKSVGGTVNEVVIPANQASFPGFVDLDYNTGGIGAHWYANANLPWLLFDDPFLLEELQFGANLRILYASSPRSAYALPGMMPPQQDREFVWGLRDLFLLSKTCPTTVPVWLRPQSYWQSCLEDCRQYLLLYVNSPARVHAVFRCWTRVEASAAWENAWGSAVIGNGILAGFTQWQSVFDWSIGKQIAMTNGTSGWSREWPCPYIVSFINNGAYYNQIDGRWQPFTDTSPDAFTVADWAAAWAFYKSGGGVNDGRPLYGTSDSRGLTFSDTGWDGHTIMEQYPVAGYSWSGYPAYTLHIRSALAVASTLGTTGAAACYSYINTELTSSLPNWGNNGPAVGQLRFSIDP